MKTFMIAAIMLAAPAAAFAQSAPVDSSEMSHSKINVAVRDDMAQAEASAQTHRVGNITARSARVGGKTIRLIDGSLPDVQTAAASQATPGS